MPDQRRPLKRLELGSYKFQIIVRKGSRRLLLVVEVGAARCGEMGAWMVGISDESRNRVPSAMRAGEVERGPKVARGGVAALTGQQATGNRQQATGNRQQATGNRQQGIHRSDCAQTFAMRGNGPKTLQSSLVCFGRKYPGHYVIGYLCTVIRFQLLRVSMTSTVLCLLTFQGAKAQDAAIEG